MNEPTPDLEPVPILLVDDRPENLQAMEAILTAPDLALHKALSGEEALGLLLEHEFALVLLDVQMPIMDGFETARLMQQSERTRSVPVIFVTAISRDEDYVFEGYASGAVDYLFKPVNPHVLQHKVSAFAEMYRQKLALRRLTEALERSAEQIAEKNEELQMLFRIIAHDLRAPLRGVRQFSRFLKEDHEDQLDDAGQDLLNRVVEAGARLDALLEDLLTLSRARQADTPSQTMPGRELVDEALLQLKDPIEHAGAQVTVHDPLPHFCVELNWARQAVCNLVANALKFTADGQPAEIEIAASRDRRTGKEQVVGLVVHDRGPGVPEDQAEKIFGLFRRAAGEKVEGTGAGLAIVRAIAERHGGTAWAEPRDGGGSSFYLTLGPEPG